MRNFFYKHSLSSHLLVTLQLVGIALCCFPVGMKNSGNTYYLILCAIGAALGLLTLCYNKMGNFSVYPEIRPHATLITSGPYRHIRHPMYTSLMIMMLGIALYNHHWLNLAGVVLVFIAVIFKAIKEEQLLLTTFAHYAKYQQKTYKVLPYFY